MFVANEAKTLAEGELNKTGEALNSTANQVNSTIENTKQQAGAVLEQTKNVANEAFNQGVKAAEQATDDQLKQLDKVNSIFYSICLKLITNYDIIIFRQLMHQLRWPMMLPLKSYKKPIRMWMRNNRNWQRLVIYKNYDYFFLYQNKKLN